MAADEEREENPSDESLSGTMMLDDLPPELNTPSVLKRYEAGTPVAEIIETEQRCRQTRYDPSTINDIKYWDGPPKVRDPGF